MFLCPTWKPSNDYGYSYLEKRKYGKKTKFLKDFYKGSQTGAFWLISDLFYFYDNRFQKIIQEKNLLLKIVLFVFFLY